MGEKREKAKEKNVFVNLEKKIQKKKSNLTYSKCQIELEKINYLSCETASRENQICGDCSKSKDLVESE